MTPFDLSTPGGVTYALLPELVLTGWTLVVLLVVSWRHRDARDTRLAAWVSLAGLLLTMGATLYLWLQHPVVQGLPQMVTVDAFRFAGEMLFLVAAAATVMISLPYVEREGLTAPEYFVLILLATVGMMFMAAAADLIVVFLGLELMSVAVYALAGFNRRSRFSAEGALKYFLIGAFAAGFLLYGIALSYGSTGSTNLYVIAGQLAGGAIPLMATLGLGLLAIGFAFKTAAVPFHTWAPDVYDGSPTPVTGFMATGVKAAAFITLARVLQDGFPAAIAHWQPVLGVLALVTMIVGNLVALVQRSLKRMLAYSSIAHAGYLLTALWSGTRFGAAALMVYLAAYTLVTLASFGLLAALGRDGERNITLDTLAGLSSRRPWVALGLALCMLSLLGFPGTVGFIGKWYILLAVVSQRQYILPVVLVLTSVISAGYYLPVVMAMYMRPAPEREEARPGLSAAAWTVIAACVVLLVVFGVWPRGLLLLAHATVAPLGQLSGPIVP